MSENDYPLEGVTVIDLGQIYNGSYATFLMAMAGANVIKVEPPHGEPLRRRKGNRVVSFPFVMLNQNKRNVILNLKKKRGKELLIELVKKADVLLENFAPGVMDKLGVGPEILRAENPRLIYASGSGFGRFGSKRDYLAMDLTVQAISGIMNSTGFPENPPVKAGPAICDFAGGTHLYGGVVTALYQREKTGKGRLVEVSMQDAVYSSLTSCLDMYFKYDESLPPRTGNRHSGLDIAPYNVYPTSDGYVAIICMTDQHWDTLTIAMGMPELQEDPRFLENHLRAENMPIIDQIVTEWSQKRTKAEIVELAQKYHVPCAPVCDLEEVINDPHLHERGMLKWVDHPELGRIVLPNTPIRFEGTPLMPLVPSPALGEHNAEIYGDWLGLSKDEMASLEANGVI